MWRKLQLSVISVPRDPPPFRPHQALYICGIHICRQTNHRHKISIKIINLHLIVQIQGEGGGGRGRKEEEEEKGGDHYPLGMSLVHCS